MNLVTRNHLERWAETALSKSTLPYLISRLVRASTPTSTKINIPWGSATYIGGWDGIVNCETETAYVPQGISLWEFGTSSDCTAKANSDYDKRKNNPIGFEPSNSTFIFITPRLWKKKDEWIREKKAENHWKNVIVYDSIDLEQWLDRILSVSLWLASQDGIGAYPFEGIITADEFWEEWSIGPKGLRLFPEIIIAGREHEKKILQSVLLGEPKIVAIKASTKNEAIAFIIAAAQTFQDEEGGQFFSKTLVVNTEENFRGIVRNNINSTLNIIPRFDETQPFNMAVSKGNHVLVPLGAGDDINLENTITLPTIDRDGQVDALIKSGILRENAERLSRESARNITILKKLLKFPQYKTKWYDNENIRDIIPALLLGRWDESFVGDIALIEKLSGQSYADYSAVLNKWRNFEESPIIQIGRTWRLTSPLDSWTNLAPQLTRNDFQNLQECFLIAFKIGNPIIEPENKDRFPTYFNNRRKYSDWSREGLVQSLILAGQIRDKLPNIDNPQDWVDNIIFNLLNNASGEVWISIDKELPLIAEASPETFLKAVKKSLEKQEPEVMDMFKEEDGFFSKTSHHTGLLWALESLAWLPEYLRDVSLILLKFSRLDPGGNLSNRPINSITEIFKPWHYQTLAPFEYRMKVLKHITEKEKALGWSLLTRMLPGYHETAFPTHKMRWRMFDKNTNLPYTYKEIWDTHSAVIEMLITIFDNDEDKFSQLIEETPRLSHADRKRVLDWADEVYPNIQHEKKLAWETIRGILSHHRSHSNASWALPETELIRFEILYNKLQPTDIIHKYIWLFNEHFPKLPEGFRYDSENYDLQLKKIDELRRVAVEEWLKNFDLETVIGLRNKMQDHRTFGKILAPIVTTREDILLVCQCLRDRPEQVPFIHEFFNEKLATNGFIWIKALFGELQALGFDNKSLSNVLIPLNQNQQLWDFVASLDGEIQDEYWQNLQPHFPHLTNDEKAYGIKMLLGYKRFFSTIANAWLFPNVIPSELLVEMLKRVVTEEANENSHLAGCEVERIFEELDKRTDIERSTLLDLECLYLPILSRKVRRSPKIPEEELANNPEFFIDVLKLLYKSKNENLSEEERKKLSSGEIQNGAERAYHLLHTWKRIPGMRDDNSIDENELNDWIQKVRLLAESVGRLEVADEEIGQVLARYLEDCPSWPEEKIFRIIEEINTYDLKRGYYLGQVNKRSFSTRGAFDGGDIEREKAVYFQKLENDFRFQYPNVAEIFKDIKKNYLAEAKRMDEEAERSRLEY
ncbi:Plasmid maintenance system antidote protein [Bacteroides heparinolyticus]|uniref:Plasmid maintenance system antidote protein n=1 Tax=Prevotella heparinolytica TaxID=28113 RepID=A0A449I3R9_9BACE|nr:hypothetical protein [Bacteroides heparinolyticus]VFB14105.1 Plasmid maintenance system antidote protein [Bacteroides heparinolyticus]